MKNTITLFIVFAFSITSLLAQDLNFENVQKEKKIKQNTKFMIGISPSVSYIPILPKIGNSYSVITTDYNNLTQQFDSITTLSSNTGLSSKLLMNFGISLTYNINKKIYIAFNPFYSLYKPKKKDNLGTNGTYLNIDDQTSVPSRPEWDTTVFLNKTNYFGLPILFGFRLNNKFSIEIGAQYLLSTTPPPLSKLENFFPISGMLAFNYNLTDRISFKLGVNFGRAFYFLNSTSLVDNLYFLNQNNIYSQYEIQIFPKEKISYINYTMTTGICFSF